MKDEGGEGAIPGALSLCNQRTKDRRGADPNTRTKGTSEELRNKRRKKQWGRKLLGCSASNKGEEAQGTDLLHNFGAPERGSGTIFKLKKSEKANSGSDSVSEAQPGQEE